MSTKKHFITFVILSCICVMAYASSDMPSASTQSTQSKQSDWNSAVRADINAQRYDAAIQKLRQANETGSADWNNLMGYTLRKKSSPDVEESERFYEQALNIDPEHRGTLEYYGELLLLKNDLSGAEALLKRLDKACTFGCKEYSELKESIAKYKNKDKSDY